MICDEDDCPAAIAMVAGAIQAAAIKHQDAGRDDLHIRLHLHLNHLNICNTTF